MDEALLNAVLASLPIMTPSGSLDLMMRVMTLSGSDISSGTGSTVCSGAGAALAVVAAAGSLMLVAATTSYCKVAGVPLVLRALSAQCTCTNKAGVDVTA